jgi:multidrug efflux pump subunit AcrA (membrane-fusion protein)
MAGKIFGRKARWRVAAGVVAALLLLGGIGLFVTEQAEKERLAAAQAQQAAEAEQQRLKEEVERQAKAAANAEAKRKAAEAEQQRLKEEVQRQAKAAADAEAKREAAEAEQQRLKEEVQRQAKAAADAEATRRAAEAEQQRLAAPRSEEERKAKAAAEAEAKAKAEQAERERLAAAQAEQERKAKPEAPAKAPAEGLPEFPWPPPRASASYVLPDGLFERHRSVGEVVAAILLALERNGYVERSFFRTKADGVALVTRLERIGDDGSAFAEPERWALLRSSPDDFGPNALFRFLRGLFVVDPGRYRIIVFILQGPSFSQSPQIMIAQEAQGWLFSGANVLPPEVAKRPFSGAHCTVMIYEFSSDGTQVRVVESRLTGKDHLAKAGVLSFLEKSN